MQPGGVILFDGSGIIRTIEGDVVTVKPSGIIRSTGVGFKGSARGGAITQTTSPKLAARLNNAPNVWEAEIDEAGDYRLKVWEWK
jgi:hypothetical protein